MGVPAGNRLQCWRSERRTVLRPRQRSVVAEGEGRGRSGGVRIGLDGREARTSALVACRRAFSPPKEENETTQAIIERTRGSRFLWRHGACEAAAKRGDWPLALCLAKANCPFTGELGELLLSTGDADELWRWEEIGYRPRNRAKAIATSLTQTDTSVVHTPRPTYRDL